MRNREPLVIPACTVRHANRKMLSACFREGRLVTIVLNAGEVVLGEVK